MEENIPKPPSPYEIMRSSVKKDFVPTEEQIKSINSFIMCRWLSNHPLGLELANYINTNYDMSIINQYWLVRWMKGIQYIAYVKKEEEINSDIELLMKYYNCNANLANRYLKIISKEQLEDIRKMYRTGGKIK